jgi:hypothetical protein
MVRFGSLEKVDPSIFCATQPLCRALAQVPSAYFKGPWLSQSLTACESERAVFLKFQYKTVGLRNTKRYGKVVVDNTPGNSKHLLLQIPAMTATSNLHNQLYTTNPHATPTVTCCTHTVTLNSQPVLYHLP